MSAEALQELGIVNHLDPTTSTTEKKKKSARSSGTAQRGTPARWGRGAQQAWHQLGRIPLEELEELFLGEFHECHVLFSVDGPWEAFQGRFLDAGRGGFLLLDAILKGLDTLRLPFRERGLDLWLR